VVGDLHVEWYRPVEAYIPQNVQVIAAGGRLYIATSRGLYALNAASGEEVWRYNTELPLGNSPTVADGVVYAGGFDHKIHALNAVNGTHLWSFDGAQAGYSTNPLVVDGRVIAGNRDGAMYAVGAHGTTDQGKLLWKFQTGGPIHLSAAYKDGIIYFASNDNYAYALRADSGQLMWKSAKLPGDGYQSFWPVIYQDKVIFSAASGYRTNQDVGTRSLKDAAGTPYPTLDKLQRDDLFYNDPDRGQIGPTSTSSEDWAHGKKIVDASRISEYLETKPWRRVVIVLNMSDGTEYTFDYDRDGRPEYAPVAWWGTRSGNYHPPVVGLDGVIYFNNFYQVGSAEWDIPQGQIMGWKIGTPFFSTIGGNGALDEPQVLSGGGSAIYRSICCDRVGDYSLINSPNFGTLWHYSSPLSQSAQGYDEMWWGVDPNSPFPRLHGNYGTKNGIYHSTGDQNSIVPYQGRLYVHRSNAIIAFGSGPKLGKLPRVAVHAVQEGVRVPSTDEIKARLESEIQKMVAAGPLRPGYYNTGDFSQHLANYFENPGETLDTLTRAYPYLSPQLQQQAASALKSWYQTYFASKMFATTGWADGSPREAMPLPPDVGGTLNGYGESEWANSLWSWSYPQYNFYALWKYAQLFPEDAAHAYEMAKSRLEAPVPGEATDNYLNKRPYELNGYIAGYLGFLNLQELAGKSAEDSSLRSTVSNELDRLRALRINNFNKDTPWTLSDSLAGSGEDYTNRTLNLSRNFIMLVPELADYLNQNPGTLQKVKEAVDEYNWVGPYWFASRYNAVVVEGVAQNLYDYGALFQAKAYILKENRAELAKFLDVPAFEKGDLFYIQNLIAYLQAGQ
jgi:hypothetical protein